MKAQTSFTPSKKLILHFDISQVLTLPAQNPDLYVPQLSLRSTNCVPIGSGVGYRKTPKMTHRK